MQMIYLFFVFENICGELINTDIRCGGTQPNRFLWQETRHSFGEPTRHYFSNIYNTECAL